MLKETTQSGWSYVLDRLVASHPAGLTGDELTRGRPEHLHENSPHKDASRLYTLGVLRREKERVPGQRMPRARYFIADLDKLPEGMRYRGSPGSGQGAREYHSRNQGVERVTPEHPANASVTLEPQDAWGVGSVARPGHIEDQRRANEQARAVVSGITNTPAPSSPYFALTTSRGVVRVGLKEAKALYLQLQEIFE